MRHCGDVWRTPGAVLVARRLPHPAPVSDGIVPVVVGIVSTVVRPVSLVGRTAPDRSARWSGRHLLVGVRPVRRGVLWWWGGVGGVFALVRVVVVLVGVGVGVVLVGVRPVRRGVLWWWGAVREAFALVLGISRGSKSLVARTFEVDSSCSESLCAEPSGLGPGETRRSPWHGRRLIRRGSSG